MIVEYDCVQCGKHVRKSQANGANHRFCSRACKAEWQRNQKPVDRAWLYQKYIVEGLDCTQISEIVGRNSKRVWEWLRDYEIPTRGRGTTGNHKYSSGFHGPHSEETKERLRQIRLKDGHVPYLKNGIHHLKGKRGAQTPNWKGGVTPERQAVYASPEWKKAVRKVWRRDNATCQRCGLHHKEAKAQGTRLEIHHIVSFVIPELRCEPQNLILLCRPCHLWVHSSENIDREFTRECNDGN